MKRYFEFLLAGIAFSTLASAGTQDRYWTPLVFRGDTTATYSVIQLDVDDSTVEYRLRIDFKAVEMLDWIVSAEATSLEGHSLSRSGSVRATSPESWASGPPPSEGQPAALGTAHQLLRAALLFDSPVDRLSWPEGFSVAHPTVRGATIQTSGARCSFAGMNGQSVSFRHSIRHGGPGVSASACVSPEAGLPLDLFSTDGVRGSSFHLLEYQETTAPWLQEMAEGSGESPGQEADDGLSDLWDEIADDFLSDPSDESPSGDDPAPSAPTSSSYAPFLGAHSRGLSGFQAQELPWRRTVPLDSYQENHRPLYLFFWKAGEPWSTAQARTVASLRSTYNERIDFLALAADGDSAFRDYQISDASELLFYSTNEGSSWLKVLVASAEKIQRHFGVASLPAAIVYDSRGRVVCAEKRRGTEGEGDLSGSQPPCAPTEDNLRGWGIGESPK
ncbi:MAG: hypothetical protein JRH01_00035 [Deltaproteobacteria bacterium]|nr:hypothetical protein [Deltaproteobacteria bacterium]